MTGNSFVDIALAVVFGLLVLRVTWGIIKMLSTPPPEIDPEDVVRVDQDYRCTVCGAEVTMRMVNLHSDAAPKHCREEMIAVWRPA